MPNQKLQNSDILYRSYSFSRDAVNVDNRTVSLAFMSEEPVERYFGDEILDVAAESVRLDRLNGGAAVLVDHNHRDQVGVVENVSLDADRVGRARVRFGKSERASEIFNDIQDGIRKHISVGYRIHRVRLEEERSDAPDVYRVVDFEPYEISIVSVPADATVGVGRTYDANAIIPFEIINKRSIEMPEATTKTETPATPSTPAIDVTAVQAQARKHETFRVREIHAIAQRFAHVDGMADEATKFINDGRELDEFREYALGRVYQDVKPLNLDDSPADLGMSDTDVRNYSLFKAVRAAAEKDWSKAGLEREVSQALAEQYGKEARGFFVPHDVLRDMSFALAGQGKELVGTDHLAGSFIDMLRNKAALGSLGARFMDGLVGNVDIPKQTGGASFYWIDNETTGTTESNLATGQVTMSPKTVSGRVDITRRLMLQSSPSAEALVRNDLIQGAALAIDLAGVMGSGINGQPTGILNIPGIGSVAGGVDGAAPRWDHIVDLESAVSVANADLGSLSYLTNSKVRGKLKKTEMFTGTNGNPVWERGMDPLNSYRAMATQQMPSNLSKGLSVGICSALLFGNFNDVIIGMWGGLDIKVDDITLGDQGGLVLRVFQDIDIAIRRAESFAAMLDVLTN